MSNENLVPFCLRALAEIDLAQSPRGILSLLMAYVDWKSVSQSGRVTVEISANRLAAATGMTRQGVYKIIRQLEMSPVRLKRTKTYTKTGWNDVNRYEIALLSDLLASGAFEDNPEVPSQCEPEFPVETPVSNNDIRDMNNISPETRVSLVKTSNIHANAALVAFIKETKKACACAKADVQFIWSQFRSLNLKNGHTNVPVRWLIRFIEVFRLPGDPRPATKKPTATGSGIVEQYCEGAAPQPRNTSDRKIQMMRAQRPAKYADLSGLERALINLIGSEAFKRRVDRSKAKFATKDFQAKWAVLGEAISQREITP